MHKASYIGMQKLVRKYIKSGRVLDVGSLNVNGTYKAIFGPKYTYVGVDITTGPNVDIVMPSEFKIPLLNDSIDAVISGQCLEHCKNPFLLVAEMFRVCKPGGMCLLVAPRNEKDHNYPIDCFRFLSEGMRSIMTTAGFTVLKAFVKDNDCWGIGVKNDIDF